MTIFLCHPVLRCCCSIAVNAILYCKNKSYDYGMFNNFVHLGYMLIRRSTLRKKEPRGEEQVRFAPKGLFPSNVVIIKTIKRACAQ